MKIVATSDPHGSFKTIDNEECDLLLIAGDICNVFGDHDPATQRAFLRNEFGPWLEAYPAKEIVWIAGNHDFIAQAPGFYRTADELPGHYLIDESIEIDGWKIYGSPWIPHLQNWAFYADDLTLRSKFKQIPDDTDILLTHGPPYGILDESMMGFGGHVGNPALTRELEYRLNPKLHVFGHIHEGYGQMNIDGEYGVEMVNASHMDIDYQPVNKPFVLYF